MCTLKRFALFRECVSDGVSVCAISIRYALAKCTEISFCFQSLLSLLSGIFFCFCFSLAIVLFLLLPPVLYSCVILSSSQSYLFYGLNQFTARVYYFRFGLSIDIHTHALAHHFYSLSMYKLLIRVYFLRCHSVLLRRKEKKGKMRRKKTLVNFFLVFVLHTCMFFYLDVSLLSRSIANQRSLRMQRGEEKLNVSCDWWSHVQKKRSRLICRFKLNEINQF